VKLPGSAGRARRWVTTDGRPLYGLLAEYENPQHLVEVCERVHHAGYRRVDAYTPYPIEAVAEALGHHHSRLPLLVLGGGIAGALGGFGLQYWTTVVDYPMNIGGRPLNSWPAFVPPTFETTILFASFTAVLGMLALNGLPQPYHPVFNIERFEHASRDNYFLAVEARDPQFDLDATRALLTESGARQVWEVPD
jgi:hypothetical protein